MTYPLVHVEWKDARSVDAWTAAGDIDITPAACQSVGFLVKSDAEAIAVAGSVEDGNACCAMIIPRAMIVKILGLDFSPLPVGLQDHE